MEEQREIKIVDYFACSSHKQNPILAQKHGFYEKVIIVFVSY